MAVDFYNRSGDKRSFYDFVVHMHLAWQNLLHADLIRRNVDIFYRADNGRYARGKDGEKRTWDLRRCLRHEYENNDPTRLNVEFFIGLRNTIEHRFQDAFMVSTAAHAHAFVVNFERELVERFGAEHSLAHELRFPVFVQALTPAGMEEQRELRRKLPAAARTYITEFEARLEPGVAADERFVYRVQLTPWKGPKSEADLAVNFVRQDELSEEDRGTMEREAKLGTVLVTEKTRDVFLPDGMLPKQATEAIAARLPFKFNISHFVRMWKLHAVRPASGDKHPDRTDSRCCVYSPAHKGYVYTPAYVELCVRELDSEEKFRNVLGMEPKRKVTSLSGRRDAKDSADASRDVVGWSNTAS